MIKEMFFTPDYHPWHGEYDAFTMHVEFTDIEEDLMALNALSQFGIFFWIIDTERKTCLMYAEKEGKNNFTRKLRDD